MSAPTSTRRKICFLLPPLLLVVVFGLLVLWGVRSFLTPSRGVSGAGGIDTPTQLARVSVPHRPNSLTWSADGSYLAAGAWGWPPEKAEACEIMVVDAGRGSVKATLRASAGVSCLAFSPDGKWLAVGTRTDSYTGDAWGELAVFDVPACTRKFTAKAGGAKLGFIDIAWSADGKVLHAIEGSDRDADKSQVRRWSVPAFTEQPAIRTPQTGKYSVLAVSPDGSTLAVADNTGLLRLFDLTNGTERTSFQIGGVPLGWRLGFASDGKAVALFDQGRPFWFDAATGKPATPNPVRIAIQPAALSDHWCSKYAFSSDGTKQVRASESHPTIIFQPESKTKHGAFIDIADSATGKTWKWRVGETNGAADTPVVAISPDGTKLAGAARQDGGEAIMIWAMPK